MHQPTWSQTVDEATVRLPVEADVAKVDVRLTSLPRKLQVSIRRQVVCDVQLHAEVEHEVRKPYICMRTYRDIARTIRSPASGIAVDVRERRRRRALRSGHPCEEEAWRLEAAGREQQRPARSDLRGANARWLRVRIAVGPTGTDDHGRTMPTRAAEAFACRTTH